jgi:hypothetical protein
VNNILPIPLYHGTSTLFLDSIIEKGLGGANPVQELKLMELCKEVYKFSEEHLKGTKLFEVSGQVLQRMSEQSNIGAFNWQHGHVYLSPSQQTAVNYAISKEFGSELLTYTIMFLKELILLEVPYVINDMYKKYRKVFGMINARASPLLIKINEIYTTSLTTEHGDDCSNSIKEIDELMNLEDHTRQMFLQQTNFRLITPIPTLDIFLINIKEWKEWSPSYNLYRIEPIKI